MVNQI